MKVDNKTNVAFNQKRNTVRISTKDRFAVGSVWIADMLHVPFGVSLSSNLSCHLQWWWSSQRSARARIMMARHSLKKRELSKTTDVVSLVVAFMTFSRSILCHAYTDATRTLCMSSAPSGLPSGRRPQTGP